MTPTDKIQLFKEHKVRTLWDENEEKWYFSVIDAVEVLTESVDARKYWNKLKQRLKEEGNETVTNCHQFKMRAADGKMRLTDVADNETADGGKRWNISPAAGGGSWLVANKVC